MFVYCLSNILIIVISCGHTESEFTFKRRYKSNLPQGTPEYVWMLHICTVRSEIINWISLSCCCLSKALTLVQTTDLKGKLAKPNQHLKEFSSPLPLLESQPAPGSHQISRACAESLSLTQLTPSSSLLSPLTWEPNLQSRVRTGLRWIWQLTVSSIILFFSNSSLSLWVVVRII